MAGRKLAVNVTTPDETGRMVTFMVGETVSAEVAKGITNPKAWGEAAEAGTDEAPSGNASLEDWQEYARNSKGASDEDLEGKSRNDLRDEFGEK